MYARWMDPHPSVKTPWKHGILRRLRPPDHLGSLGLHRPRESTETHRILAAGDLNIAHGYGDGGNPAYWEARYRSVFDRMAAIGMEFMGPQAPDGRQAKTRATGEPPDSRNVVTFYLPGKNPETGNNIQLDYVFASRGFHESLKVRALNEVDEWGSSDHCRVLITVGDG